MKMRTVIIGILSTLSLAAFACSAEPVEDAGESEGAATATLYPKLPYKLPPEAPAGQSYNSEAPDRVKRAAIDIPDLMVNEIVKAMKLVRDTYYPKNAYPGKEAYPFPSRLNLEKMEKDGKLQEVYRYADEPATCMNACPAYYSELVCQFYCYHPSYQSVSPNVRGCFTQLARGRVPVKDTNNNDFSFETYSQMYAYCLYAENAAGKGYDVARGQFPAWDESQMLKAFTRGKPAGVLSWVHTNEEKAFQYVMYTWYNPWAFSEASQQVILNKFYGVKLKNPSYTAADADDVAECQKKRPVGKNDPANGTHCSSKKRRPQYFSYELHPQYDQIVAKMKQLHGE